MMKQIITILCVYISIAAYGQKQIVTNADLDRATVFLTGAQLFHSSKVNLPAGQSEVVIQGLSATLDQNSVQGGGIGEFTIMDIQFRYFYPEPVNITPELTATDKKIKAIQDSIVELDYDLRELSTGQEVLNVQKNILMNNKLLHSTLSDSLELIKSSVIYYEQKMQELLAASLKIEKKQYYLNVQRSKMSARINELQLYRNQQATKSNPNAPVPQIVMQVMAEAATTATVEVNYITNNAGWYATYDIRATDIAKPVDLAYKANIWQNSGIEWKNVELTCSTGNPLLGNTLPELTTWYLGYYNYYYERDQKDDGRFNIPKAETLSLDEYTVTTKSKTTAGATANNASNYTVAQQTITNVEFNIKLKYTIPSDGKGHIVALQTKQLPTTYNYLVVPKIEQSAFLIARITEWEGINLLPGNVNLYFNNSYVGKTFINPMTMSDTLSLSMGRDNSIEVKRTMVTDKSTDRLIGANNKKVMTFSLEVRNTKAIPIEVIIKDHIPVSQSDDIEVELLDKSGGEVDELTGLITWREKLKSKDKKSWTLSFEVTYPKNEPISFF